MASRRTRSRHRSRMREPLPADGKSRRRRRRRSKRRFARTSLLFVVLLAVLLGIAYLVRTYMDSRGAVRYEQAQLAFDAGDYQASAIALEQLLSVDSDNLPALVLAGRTYLRLGYVQQAEQALRKAQRAGADPAAVLVPLTRVYLQQGKFQRLIDEFPVRSADKGLQGRLLLMHGQAHLQLRQYDDAESAFTQASSLLPHAQGPICGLARVALHHRNFELAQQLVGQAAVMAPDDPQVWFVKGEIAHARQDVEQAMSAYANAIQLDSRHVGARVARAQMRLSLDQSDAALEDLKVAGTVRANDPQVIYLRALSLTRVGEHEQVQRLIENTSSTLLRYSTDFIMHHPPSLLLMGVLRFRSNSFDQAAPLLHRYVQLEAGNSGARKLLASVQLIRGLPALALTTLSSQLADPDDPELLALLAQANSQSGQHDEAAKQLWRSLSVARSGKFDIVQQALIQFALNGARDGEVQARVPLDLDASFEGASLMLRVLAQRSLELEASLRTVRILAREQPEHAPVANLHGALALLLGELDESRMALERALVIEPGFPAAERNLARVDAIGGEVDAARARLQALLQQHPRDPQAMVLMAQLEMQQQQLEPAIDWMRRAIEIHPHAIGEQLELLELYLRVQRIEDARTLVKTLGERYPGSESVRMAQRRVSLASGAMERPGTAPRDGETLAPVRP